MSNSRMKRRRAPRGYRIVQWADGFYHAYEMSGGGRDCIGEFLSRKGAIIACKQHQIAKRNQQQVTP